MFHPMVHFGNPGETLHKAVDELNGMMEAAHSGQPEGYRYSRHATSRLYSWISPPKRSRLRTPPPLTELDGVRGEGGASRSPQCGRSPL